MNRMRVAETTAQQHNSTRAQEDRIEYERIRVRRGRLIFFAVIVFYIEDKCFVILKWCYA